MENIVERNLYSISLRYGMSLLVLVLTIVLSLILISAVVIATQNVIDDSKLTIFAKNLNTIQDAVKSYYITNNVMPTLNSPIVMTKDELVAMSKSQDMILQELTENNDLDSTFYKIDLAKINITKIEYGNGKSGENDIFVISYPSMNVYYPYGLDAKDITYFSITSKISNVIQIPQNNENTSPVSIISTSGIKVTKTDNWSNKMGVSLEAEIEPDELLYMSVSGDSNRLITTTIGKNIFGFDLLSSIVNGTETIKIPSLTLEEANYIEMGIKPLSERYVDILKYNGTDLIGKVRIDLSDFSRSLPTITSATLSSSSTVNTVNLQLASSESGIKEIRYEYLTKYTDKGTIENYYSNTSDFDSVYMTSKSKRANLNKSMNTIIHVPKNVQSIKVAVIDRAGNINLYNQEMAPRLYIGYTIDNNTKGSVEANVPESLQLTAKVFSTNGVKTISFSKSIDGINFTDEQVYTLNTTINGTTNKQCIPYTGILKNNAYIKIVAVNYNGTLTETRILNVDMKDVIVSALGINVIATENKTVNGLTEAYNNPIIPKGFKAVNDGAIWPIDWNSGLVIQDASGNQFVWVPVDGINVSYAKWCVTGRSYTTATDDTLPSGIIELNQITKYGGFYIARYESMFDYNGGIIRVASKKSINKAGKGWSRNNTYTGYLWNFINYTDAKSYAESMAVGYGYDLTKVVTNLVTGAQWDTTMKWIQNSGKSVTNSRTWGNYSNSTTPANVSGYGKLQISGYSEYWKAKNIYDLAGNTFEWTNEKYSNNYIGRGGRYGNVGTTFPAAYRDNFGRTTSNVNISFRIALYIK